MFSVAPNIVFAPNMTQNAERKHRTQDTNTANFRSYNVNTTFKSVANVLVRFVLWETLEIKKSRSNSSSNTD